MWFDLLVPVIESKKDKDDARIFLPLDFDEWKKTMTEDVESWGMYTIRVANNPQSSDGERSVMLRIVPTGEEGYSVQGEYFGFSMGKETAKELAKAMLFAAENLLE